MDCLALSDALESRLQYTHRPRRPDRPERALASTAFWRIISESLTALKMCDAQSRHPRTITWPAEDDIARIQTQEDSDLYIEAENMASEVCARIEKVHRMPVVWKRETMV